MTLETLVWVIDPHSYKVRQVPHPNPYHATPPPEGYARLDDGQLVEAYHSLRGVVGAASERVEHQYRLLREANAYNLSLKDTR